MVKRILILPVFFLVFGAFASTIRGKIYDQDGLETLPGATVAWIKDGKIKKAAVADKVGEYILEGVEDGNQILQIRHIGYKVISKSIYVNKELMYVDFNLEINVHDMSPYEIIGYSDKIGKNITGAISKMDVKTMDLLKPVGTQDALEYIPGINTFSDDGMGNSRTSIGIRGIDPRRSAKVLVLEDGIPLQPALYLYPFLYYNPPVERIDEIEVIKGSGAIKYGPQTMGGVINYITTRPRTSFGGESQLILGENNYRSFFNEIGGWGNAKYQPEIQLLYKSADGYRENNSFEQFNGTVKLKVLSTEKSNWYIKANLNKEVSDATYTGLTEYSFKTNPRFNPKKFDQFNVFRTAVDFIQEKELSSKLLLTSRTYFNYFDRKWWRENDVFVRADQYHLDSLIPVPWWTEGDLIRVGNGKDNFGNLRTFYVAGYQREYKLRHEFLGLHSNLDAGIRGHWERFTDDRKIGFSPDARDGYYYVTKGLNKEWDIVNTKLDNNADSIAIIGQSMHYETSSVSLFMNEKIHFSENLIISPGFRLEAFEQERINRLKNNEYRDKVSYVFLPGCGFNYEFNAVLNLFGGIHRGFTPPATSSLIITNFGQNLLANQELKSEKSWNAELGIRGSSPKINFEISGFHLLMTDMIGIGKGTVLTNLGKIRNWGVENQLTLKLFELHASLVHFPAIIVNYTYLHTEVLTGEIKSAISAGNVSIAGKQLPYAPTHTFSGGLLKDFKQGFSLMLDMRFVSRSYTDFENIARSMNRGDQGIVPAYTVYNVTAKYAISKNWDLYLTGKNLSDHVYLGSRLHSNPGQPEANLSSGILPGSRRQINIGVKYKFGKFSTKSKLIE